MRVFRLLLKMRDYPHYARMVFQYSFYSVFFKKVGWGIRIYHPTIGIDGKKNIEIGKRVVIHKHIRMEAVKRYREVAYTPKIVIQDGVTIQQNVHITCANSIFIGNHTSVGANVSITDIHHPYTDIALPIEEQTLEVKSVHIGKNGKIYNNAVILPGTRLGQHCTVGANSVVSGVFPDFTVIVGAPAHVVKRYNFITQHWERTLADGTFIEE